jgi:cysteine desulfurase
MIISNYGKHQVIEKVIAFLTSQFGNASSIDHSVGNYIRVAVDQAEQEIAPVS